MSYDFGQIALEAVIDSGCTATGRPFCHCTMHSIPDSDTREPLPTVKFEDNGRRVGAQR